MAWGGRSFNQAANFTASRNHGFSGDTLHVGGNVGSSLSAAHASQYNGSQHVGIRHSGDSAYSTGVTQAVRGYGPVPRRAGPLARRFGS
jgi:TPP-dependent pyruvate/acetoin dehydrogenase alpha subunit